MTVDSGMRPLVVHRPLAISRTASASPKTARVCSPAVLKHVETSPAALEPAVLRGAASRGMRAVLLWIVIRPVAAGGRTVRVSAR